MLVLLKYGISNLIHSHTSLLNFNHIFKCIWEKVTRWVSRLGLYESLLDNAVDSKIQTNYSGRAARSSAIANRENGLHIQLSNLSLSGCPTHALYPHSEQAVLRLHLWTKVNREGKEGCLSAPSLSELKLQKANERFLYPYSWPFLQFNLQDLKGFKSVCLYPAWEKAMATHSRTLAWKIPWMEEPGRLQSMESLRVGHDWATSLSLS